VVTRLQPREDGRPAVHGHEHSAVRVPAQAALARETW